MSDCPARIEALLNSLSAMFYFCGEDDLARFLIDDGDPGRLRAGVYFESKIGRLNVRCFSLQDNGEGVEPKDCRLSLFQQQSGAAGRGRRQRFPGCVQNWNFHIDEGIFRFGPDVAVR